MANIATRWMLLLAAASAAAPVGCQARARLEASAGMRPSETEDFKSHLAAFGLGEKGKQTIVLAFKPTGAPPSPETTSSGLSVPSGQSATMQYAPYLVLEVPKGGGTFKIGERVMEGQVRASYWVYNERNELDSAVPDRYGAIHTQVWPLFGWGPSPDDWWIAGQFDLMMAGNVRLVGSFLARPDQELVQRFVKEKRISFP